MSGRVLVVDDEQDVRRLLTFNLERAGFETFAEGTGSAALLTAARVSPTVIVLDLMLPDLGGMEICQRLRSDSVLSGVGILMLTALGSDNERIDGLAAGADDYVVKPFNVEEVVLRVKALAARIGERGAATGTKQDAFRKCGNLRVNLATYEVTVGSSALSLRPLEFKILSVLIGDPGRVFSREELLSQVWDLHDTSNPRLVDVHIRRLRQNLGAAAELVETVPGFGYRLRDIA